MFPTFDRVKELANKQGLSINDLEEKIDFSRNSLYSWKNSEPKPKKLNVVADYFNVSTDYLLGRTDNPRIATDDDVSEIDLKKDAAESFFYDGHELNDEDLDLIASILETRIKNRK
ncbi:helix-turn-helix domain-containing protein [Streptococcus suis]|uniref:helix-turn-helix domain-containing protein n=1 Tax=Streptococcus suis TaxID=1307 RepID=UPI000CF69953|nr:helix-turn-helix transcriptional regulator [Streptococcus suis]